MLKFLKVSVRDALSLLDRALISKSDGQELDFNNAQKIFLDILIKVSLIELFKNLFEGNEENVIRIYRSIYDKGVEPKIFLNDFFRTFFIILKIFHH